MKEKLKFKKLFTILQKRNHFTEIKEIFLGQAKILTTILLPIEFKTKERFDLECERLEVAFHIRVVDKIR